MLKYRDVNGDRGMTEALELHFLGDESHLEAQLLTADGALVRAEKIENAVIAAELAKIREAWAAEVHAESEAFEKREAERLAELERRAAEPSEG